LQNTYDIAVIGGRVAGSAAAIVLGCAGYRVLLVERDAMPCDTLSTHLLWPDGVAALGRLGVLERVVASGAPVGTHFHKFNGEEQVTAELIPFEGENRLMCPRREILDGILFERAAATHGVDAYDRTRLTGLRWEGDRVAGVEITGPDGTHSITTQLVVGADGRYSFVARSVGAREHDVLPPGRYWYYGYFRNARPPEPTGFFTSTTETDMIGSMATHDGLQMVLYGAFNEDYADFKHDHTANYLARVTAHPIGAEMLADAELDSPVYGFAGIRGYYRDMYGPGWVLLGDAAHQKDPLAGRGINEALRGAEWLAQAAAGDLTDAALAQYAALLRERTWTKSELVRIIVRPDKYMTAEQGGVLERELKTPEGFSEYLRMWYDDGVTFEAYFNARVAATAR
jgi:2-polyprenyl-6-methoxyphenol hydroxylase-like FAD-dependent oxidoreductase